MVDLGLVMITTQKFMVLKHQVLTNIHSCKKWVEAFKPVKPDTIAKSLAIGNPADGINAINLINDINSYSEDVSDEEIVNAMKLLAETEGIFTETAGGVTLGCTIKMLENGKINKDEDLVWL